MMIIGLTGGIATGKSTVSGMLASLGAVIIDADKIAREVVEPYQPTWYKLRDSFGEEIFEENGQLDRKKLGSIIFNNGHAREKLNQIMHPAIRSKMNQLKEEFITRGEELIVLDIPLLFESELEYMVEKVLVIYVPEEIQKARLISRDSIDAETALKKIKSQMPIEQKKEKGHAYVDNSGSYEATREQVEQIIQQWRMEKK
jgi:dephospho-CoA kinase